MSGLTDYRKLLGKILISGTMTCLTGLHIGASKESLEIGALDAPVVRDPITKEPYVPGSSFKGKLRALLEKAFPDLLPNRDGGSKTSRHECLNWEKGKNCNKNFGNIEMSYPGDLNCPVCRLFGSLGDKNFPARLKVRDMRLTEESRQVLERIDTGLLYTEWKFENGIDRITSAANPRSLERVPAGTIFRCSMVYDVEDLNQMVEDLRNLQFALRLLENDSLGGHGSRGYGHVVFSFDRCEARSIDFYRWERKADNSQTFSSFDGEVLEGLKNFFAIRSGNGQ
ncbi:type III-A CRISPR-associated RAMP protein Csm3 [Thermodesulforhabdus norvegica]|uniref:CRISPR system Cms endoribonuclease Csm3 n=1 Tax=Thermodesulforhabdus norvegica TaxID=39841 RepID=A0A1I4TBL4_9BACT|nr:type III-A CRISPR-associated RAMP protein Csm3 [Thermodesulforhabdus norvegica]SFM73970.1 CRISPR-associated protein Csm3 [Thermodesulforhabdus norvegica]